MRKWAQAQSGRGKARAYLYYFIHVPPSTPGAPSRGATHGAETSYVFQNLAPVTLQWTELDRQVADTVSSYWANFAAKGDPNGKGLPVWPAYGKSNIRPMVLGDKIEVGPEPDKAKLDFFENYYSSLQKHSQKQPQIPLISLMDRNNAPQSVAAFSAWAIM